MSAAAVAAWPRSQHWRVDGFRVTVLLYRSHRRDRCAVCGQVGAIHCVWADGFGDRAGFSAASADFCDAHRPAKGTLPPLAYRRSRWHAEAALAETEHLRPDAGDCEVCGTPAGFEFESICRGCDDPARWRVETSRVVSLGGERMQTSRLHASHVTGEWVLCGGHRREFLAAHGVGLDDGQAPA